jgi:hypothetical protein
MRIWRGAEIGLRRKMWMDGWVNAHGSESAKVPNLLIFKVGASPCRADLWGQPAGGTVWWGAYYLMTAIGE